MWGTHRPVKVQGLSGVWRIDHYLWAQNRTLKGFQVSQNGVIHQVSRRRCQPADESNPR